MLNNLSAILTKAQAHAVDNKMDSHALLQTSLFPDMLNLTRQVQISSDFAKGVTARLAGIELPMYEDNETSFAELQARITKTLHFISSVEPIKVDGSEDREVITREGTPKEKRFTGQSYLLEYGIPQFLFHVTTAYAILRNQGVPIGKRDYMGT